MVSLRRRLARLLRALAALIDVPEPGASSPLLDLARRLVREQEDRWPERSGEAKRHQVLAALIDAFPGVSKRALSRAIEDVLP